MYTHTHSCTLTHLQTHLHSRTSLVTKHNTKADRLPRFPWVSHYSNTTSLLLLFLHQTHTHRHTHRPPQPPRALSLPKSTSTRRDVGPCQNECLDKYLNSRWLFEEFPGDGSLCWHHQGEQVVYPQDVSHLKVSWIFCPRLSFSGMHMPAGCLYFTFQLSSTVFLFFFFDRLEVFLWKPAELMPLVSAPLLHLRCYSKNIYLNTHWYLHVDTCEWKYSLKKKMSITLC